MLEQFANLLVYRVLGLDPASSLGAAGHFFIYDTFKIGILLVFITLLMGIVNSYFPVERVRDFLGSRKLYGGQYLVASSFGAMTPFCSCSSIPLFIGFLQGGMPLGVTLSYLITSPLVNEVALALFIGIFGWKIALVYAGSGILLGTLLGALLSRFGLERWVESWVWQVASEKAPPSDVRGLNTGLIKRLRAIVREAWRIIRKVGLYVLAGVAIGAVIHGYVPSGYFEAYLSSSNPFAVPAAVILALPMYAGASGVIPIVQSLVAKGIPLGTALAFMMAVVGLSFPEAMILKKVMKPKLIMTFFGSVGFSIILLGYFFNIVL